jgi:hypothetical protein
MIELRGKKNLILDRVYFRRQSEGVRTEGDKISPIGENENAYHGKYFKQIGLTKKRK